MENESQVKKLEEWICKNPKDWKKICRTKGETIDLEEYKRLAELLKQDNLCEMILVLATCHYYVIETHMDLILDNLKYIVNGSVKKV